MIPLKNTTIIIPFKLDTEYRQRNLDLNLKYLTSNFDVNIILVETGLSETYVSELNTIQKVFIKNDVWNKCMVVNRGIQLATTPVIAIIDTDIFHRQSAYINAEKQVLETSDILINYNKPVIDVDSFSEWTKAWNIEDIPTYCFKKKWRFITHGGSVWGKRNVIKEGGMMNEHFKEMGREDKEFVLRFKKLGYNVTRGECEAYHMSHPLYKIKRNQIKLNHEEYSKINRMTSEQLKDYINSWQWNKY